MDILIEIVVIITLIALLGLGLAWTSRGKCE